MTRNCCILYNQPLENALADELDVLDQVEFIEKNLKLLGIKTFRKGITGGFMEELKTLALEKPDFVFNLVESISNKGEICYFIPALLNMNSIPYTGNPLEALFITTSKSLTHKLLTVSGINTPGTYKPSEHSMLQPGLTYIIKPVWEDGSQGITAESVFTYSRELDKKLELYDDSHWLIQEYIDGREFNITVLTGKNGPEVMPPAEIIFRNFDETRPKIVDFKAKWEEESFEYENTIRCFPGEDLDVKLRDRLSLTALRCWDVFGLKGYARVDMRVDKSGIPYVVEVNANPCISPDSGVVAAVEQAGLSFTEVVNRIINDLN
ncbi:MAG: ATP-grasp domain-containing protein [Bacteroidales bacterium]|jgi:D-alanine-D-alanine ligase|nr:ATP-grasp domain-containing protein [Bacteroidales bacterium]